MKQQEMLSTHRLKIGYRQSAKETVLFQELDLTLCAGELVCFMGPNGIGKSSLIRTLANLQPPLEGSVIWNGNSLPKEQAIAVVLTDKIASATMTVHDLISLGRYPYLDWTVRLTDRDSAIIDRSIAQVRIEHLRDRKISELSDGQLQMVMIARAFAQDTPIILLDEPTAHLDLNNRVEIMKLLKSLSRSTQKTILVSTHELDLALQMADRIWLAGTQQNILTGLPEDLVLQGAFDSIFQFKGFDLKTGKVQHDIFQPFAIQVVGEGPDYLWTKNALERNGYEVTRDIQAIRISVVPGEDRPSWKVYKGDTEKHLLTLSAVLDSL